MKKVNESADEELAEATRLSRSAIPRTQAVDMSESAINDRLQEVAELSRLCLELGQLSPPP